jgi:hypothetical protein
MMRPVPLALAALALAGCSGVAMETAPAFPTLPLANAGFEEASTLASCAPGWNCSMHADPKSFRFALDHGQAAGGRASLCIEPVTREPWGKATQSVTDPRLRGKHVRFSLAVRTEGVAGNGAGPLVVAYGGSGQILVARQQFVKGTAGWRRVALELDVPATAYVVEVGAALEGTGRACIDDARLEILS